MNPCSRFGFGSVTVLLVATACGGVRPAPYPGPVGYVTRAGFQEADEPQSLFPSDIAVLSDSAIRRILAYEVTFADSNKVAVMQLPGVWGYRWWADASSNLDAFVANRLISILETSTRVREAAILPALMVPGKRSVPFLREAAARFQADLLFVFQPRCESFRRSRFLASDEVEANCTVEAVLLDVRTGIVPFSDVVSKESVARRGDEDANFQETIVRTELRSITDALTEVADGAVRFLELAPRGPP